MARRDGFSDGRKRKQQDAFSDVGVESGVGQTYNYVQGGFEEKAPVSAGNQTSMYAAFDSALRASNYNMFCSPLKPVNAPTQFKASSPGRKPSARGDESSVNLESQKWVEEEEEDPEEVRRRTEAEYRELDKLIGAENRGLGGEGSKPVIRKMKVGAQKQKQKGKGKGTILVSKKEPVLEEEEEEAAAAADEYQEQIQEGYEELQKLLALKPKGKTKRKVDSARFTGNMTQHRIDGSFKAVTVKDPLKRVYATRLRGESAPTVGSSEAVRRPGKPPADAGKAGREAGAGGEEVAVDEVLATLRGKQQPAGGGGGGGGGGAAAGRRGGKGGRGDPAKRPRGKAAGEGKKRGAAKPGGERGGGKGGTLVLNHSTNIEGLLEVLERLCQVQGIQTVVPGRLAKAGGREPRLVLRVTAPTADGFKCIARRGSQVQEVFVVSDLDIETMQAAVAWSL